MPKIITLSGIVGWEITARDIRAALAEAKGDDIELHVNSPGGLVFEGIEIFNLLRQYKGNSTVIITSLAASAASYFILGADKVVANDNAVFMIHNALTLSVGNHHDMRKTADVLESISNIIAKAYAAKTGKSLDHVKELMDKESYFFGDEILHAGFADEVIESPERDQEDKDQALMSARVDINMCLDQMRNTEAANQDLGRAVAYFDSVSTLLGDSTDKRSNPYRISDEEYAAGEAIEPEAPYPNEHACRVREPNEFEKDSFRRISRKANGKTLDIIIGKLKGKTTTTTQAFRYPKDEWTSAEAKKHCNDHNGKTFESASGSSSADNGGCGGGT